LRWRHRCLLLTRIDGVAMEQVVDLADVEAEGREVAAELRELAGLECQKLVVPVGPFGKLVVGENERPLSRRAEIGELNCRHLG
jgi:hypothetical protein